MSRRPSCSTLFPYTTLFRSRRRELQYQIQPSQKRGGAESIAIEDWQRGGSPAWHVRSEEHTSELQSLTNLVCRLLLEKKKKESNCVHKSDSDVMWIRASRCF